MGFYFFYKLSEREERGGGKGVGKEQKEKARILEKNSAVKNLKL